MKSIWCRQRLRMFPALVNCCTIDWFREWPAEALASVATSFLQVTPLTSPCSTRRTHSHLHAVPPAPTCISVQYLQPLSLSYSAWGCSFYLPGSSPLWSHRHSSYPQQIMEVAGLIIGLGSCCAACTLGQLCAESSLCSLSLNYSKRCSAVSCAQQQVEALPADSPNCIHRLSVDEHQHNNRLCVRTGSASQQ